MMVVSVLMMSCQVFKSRNKKKVGAQTTTITTQKVKNAARLATFDDHPANRSNTPTRDETSLGMSTARLRFLALARWSLLMTLLQYPSSRRANPVRPALVRVYPFRVVTWTADDSFELGGNTYVCRPVGRRFVSEPGRFCLLKARWEVEWYERFLEERSPQSIVEVGSYDGASSGFFVDVAHPRRLVTIDQRPEASAALADFISRRGLNDVLTAYNGVDQSDTARLREILADAFGTAELDLVIDDASHLVEPTRATFNCLFPRLARGGMYVIEDWSWAHSGLALDAWADQQPLTTFVFELILACAHQPAVISNVQVLKNYALVERGPGQLDPDSFDVSECYGSRGAALIAGP
jgi:hypothetical protein